MSYQVLARKWRPQNFQEMVGQQHVLKALVNALDSDRLHHAYLFTGTRGVGKTTIARVLAKCLNCEQGITSTPCGHCSSCQEITEGRFVDLIEVDAASRTKVEDTRELLDNVQYAPTRGRFKVYLIDEIHMLSGHSFNALLKTLEEPPSHVKFLFATTDPQKLPVTILSRCLQFNLKRMTVDMIAGHLATILFSESIDNDPASLRLISRAADGSMRDALSLLDQAIAFGAGALKETEVREMLGTISHQPLLALLKAVTRGEGEAILEGIEQMAGVTPDFEAATDALISLLHKMAVLQIVPQAEEEDQAVKQLADQFSKEDVQLYYQIALHGRRDLSLSPDPRSGFEMIFLRLLTFRPLGEIAPASTSISSTAINKKKTSLLDSNNQTSPLPTLVISDLNNKATNTTFATPEKIESDDNSEPIPLEWYQIITKLNLTGRAAELIKHCVLNQLEANKIHLILDKNGEDLLAKTTELQIETALSEYYNKPMQLVIDIQRLTEETPATRLARQHQECQHIAEDLIQQDPFVNELQHRFKAQIVPNSIKPN